MHRFTSGLVLIVALAVVASGCGSSGSTTPTTPTPTTITESFTGTLTLNGGVTHSFTVTGVGGITATLISLAPDPNNPVGLSLGTWNGSICTVPPGVFNDKSIQGSVVIGQTQTLGDFCVRIYDAAGTVVNSETYTITVDHQ